MHYISPIADFERFAHVVIGNHNAYALCLERPDKALDFHHRERVYPCKRLIEQNKAGLRNQSARDFDAPALATRKPVGLILGKMGYAQLTEKLFKPGVHLLPADLQGFENGHYILFHGQLPKDRRFLRQVGYPFPGPQVHRLTDYVLSIQIHGPAVRTDYAHNAVKSRRFPGAVWPKQPHNLRLMQFQADMIDHAPPLISFYQVLDDKLFDLARHGYSFFSGNRTALTGAPLPPSTTLRPCWR